MEIVIKIPEEDYIKISNSNPRYADDFNLYYAIKNGTPLPKGHGNLVDYDDLVAKLDRYGRKDVKYQLPYSPTIIFADNLDKDILESDKEKDVNCTDLCKSCNTKGCIFQSGIARSHCDFYKAKSEE